MVKNKLSFSKPTKIKQKAAAVALYVSTVLENFKFIDEYPELTQLVLQAERSRKVFAVNAGKVMYLEIHNKLKDIWIELQEETKEDDRILEHEVPLLIRELCSLIHPNEFKSYFGIRPFYIEETEEYLDSSKRIVKAILKLEVKLNKTLGTKTYLMTLPPIKKIKEKKKITKPKIKNEVKPKPLTSKQRKGKEELLRKKRIKSKLKELVEKAKQKEGNYEKNFA